MAVNRKLVGVHGELLALNLLRENKIQCQLGKNSLIRYIDIVTHAGTIIEVKYSQRLSGWGWTFYSTHNDTTPLPDVIMLIGARKEVNQIYCYVLNAFDDFFFSLNGKRKYNIAFSSKAKAIKTLSPHRDNFDVIKRMDSDQPSFTDYLTDRYFAI